MYLMRRTFRLTIHMNIVIRYLYPNRTSFVPAFVGGFSGEFHPSARTTQQSSISSDVEIDRHFVSIVRLELSASCPTTVYCPSIISCDASACVLSSCNSSADSTF